MACMAILVASATALVIASLIIFSVAIVCFIFYFFIYLLLLHFLLLTPWYEIMPCYDDNTVHMLDLHLLSVHSYTSSIITSAVAYVNNKHHPLLTHDWLQYACCIGCASRNSPNINITTATPYQAPLRCIAYALQAAFKKSWKDYKNTKYWQH